MMPRDRRPAMGGAITRSAVGGAAWILFVLLARPAPTDTAWIHALLLLAPLVLVPLALGLLPGGGEAGRAGAGPSRHPEPLAVAIRVGQLPAALLLAGAYLVSPGWLAAVLALPWLGVTGLVALGGQGRLRRRGVRPLADLVVDAGAVFLAVGGVWALSDRLGYRPLGFATAIVVLTAVHFHYAGFLLPLFTGLAMRRIEGPVASLTGIGVIVAVPLVAIGITATQLELGPAVETAAALVMAAGGMLAAALHLRLAARPGPPTLARVLWAICGVSLVAGMALAALYGSRFFLHLPWLDVGWMQASHGVVNAFGFGLAGVLGWRSAAAHVH